MMTTVFFKNHISNFCEYECDFNAHNRMMYFLWSISFKQLFCFSHTFTSRLPFLIFVFIKHYIKYDKYSLSLSLSLSHIHTHTQLRSYTNIYIYTRACKKKPTKTIKIWGVIDKKFYRKQNKIAVIFSNCMFSGKCFSYFLFLSLFLKIPLGEFLAPI